MKKLLMVLPLLLCLAVPVHAAKCAGDSGVYDGFQAQGFQKPLLNADDQDGWEKAAQRGDGAGAGRGNRGGANRGSAGGGNRVGGANRGLGRGSAGGGNRGFRRDGAGRSGRGFRGERGARGGRGGRAGGGGGDDGGDDGGGDDWGGEDEGDDGGDEGGGIAGQFSIGGGFPAGSRGGDGDGDDGGRGGGGGGRGYGHEDRWERWESMGVFDREDEEEDDAPPAASKQNKAPAAGKQDDAPAASKQDDAPAAGKRGGFKRKGKSSGSKQQEDRSDNEQQEEMVASSGQKGKPLADGKPETNAMASKLEKEGRVVLYMDFDIGESIIKPEFDELLDEIETALLARPNLRVRFEGYTDNTGAADHSKKVSEIRANGVKDALIARGIDESRLSAGGFGQDKPIADNRTEEGKAKNRRVEMVKL